MPRKIDLETAKKKFSNRMDISLIDYKGWKKKSKFFDKNINEEFWAVPYSVYTQKSSHPKRKWEKFRQTNLIKYGVEIPSKSVEIKRKIRQKHLQNNSDLNISQCIINKRKDTNIKKYGVDNPFKGEEFKKKSKKTCLLKYGTEYASTNVEIKKKIKNTFVKKYGVVTPLLIIKHKKATRKKNIVYYVSETNEPVVDWFMKQVGPKPASSTLRIFCRQQQNSFLSSQTLDKFIKDFIDNKTQLEALSEQLFETKHFNKKPKQIKKNYRPDFRLSPKIFLNVDGLYWHSEKQKDKKYHLDLRKEFEDNGLRIFQFREDEIRDKPDVVKSIVDNALGETKNKIFAQKCEIKKVKQKEAAIFLNQNHLMGSANVKHLGLYFNSELVSLLSFKQRKHVCKIERFCSVLGTNVVGGFSKLLQHLENNYLKPEVTEIHNWVDLRYGAGNHLKNKGFNQIKEILGWKWTDNINTYNRLKCRANIDERKLTQQRHTNELGWVKIFDAGQRLYVKFCST